VAVAVVRLSLAVLPETLVELVAVVLLVGMVAHLSMELLTQEVAVEAAARVVTTELVELAVRVL
jgi:hypothetical protein